MLFAERRLKTSAFWRYQTLSGFVCLIPGNNSRQFFVEVLWNVLVLLFSRIFWIFSASKGFSAGHYSDVNIDVLGRTMPEEEMFLVCWNLQVGADIYTLYNRAVLSCLAGCLCKLWNSCEWWQQTLAGGDQRPFRIKLSQHQALLSMQNNSKLSKKFIWDTSAEKESVRKIQCRNYDEGTERTPRKKRLEHQKIFTATRDLRS